MALWQDLWSLRSHPAHYVFLVLGILVLSSGASAIQIAPGNVAAPVSAKAVPSTTSQVGDINNYATSVANGTYFSNGYVVQTQGVYINKQVMVLGPSTMGKLRAAQGSVYYFRYTATQIQGVQPGSVLVSIQQPGVFRVRRP